MTNDQPYRRALPRKLALAEIVAKSGSHFDPELTRTFVEFVRRGVSAPVPG
jgi:HD-GYP domain-containing protein (c-di-GMP phosphodiesterase class II)